MRRSMMIVLAAASLALAVFALPAGIAAGQGAGDGGLARPAPGFGAVCTSGETPCVDPRHAALLLRDRPAGGQPAASQQAPLVSPAGETESFDWVAAGIGAAAALGAVLLVLAGDRALRGHGQPT